VKRKVPAGELTAVGDEVDLEVAGDVPVGPATHDGRDLLAQQGARLGLRHLAADKAVTEDLQVALDGAHAGLEQELAGGVVEGELGVLLEQGHQLGEEGLETLRADVARGLPGNPKALLEVEAVATLAAPSASHRYPLAPAQHGDGVLAAVAGGQTEGVEDSTPLGRYESQLTER
jgi:hypothetical protein